MLLKSLAVWLLIVPLAVANGAFRDAVLAPWLGERVALPVSGVLLCLWILLVAALVLPRCVRGSSRLFWRIGLCWLLLTVLFESALVWATGGGVRQVLAAYDPGSGNLWALVVLFTGAAPWLGAKIRGVV